MLTMLGPMARQPQDANDRLLDAFATTRARLIGTLTRMLGSSDDALDIAQTTFLKCWQTRTRMQEVRNLKAWVFRVGLNAGRDLLRDAWRRHSRPLSTISIRSLPARIDRVDREALDLLRDALADLRPAEREVFLLRQYSDRTYEEIAAQCCIPVGTVKTRMRTAVIKLREALHKAG
jgi:RNA polymerase sigma-70 factor (ECF subfamily)